MDHIRTQAYRFLLAQALLHLKWDLVSFRSGLSLFRPWQLLSARRRIHIAAQRAYTFHNLAIYATLDFKGFSEEWFWKDIDGFSRRFPETLCPYREVFARFLRDQPVCIIAPFGWTSTNDSVDENSEAY